MDAKQTDSTKIAKEAVGERPGSAIPDAAKQKVARSPEHLAASAGPQASVAVKTAESVGERVGDAYAYPDATTREVHRRSHEIVRNAARARSRDFIKQQPVMAVIAGFALGYAAAFMVGVTRR